MDLDRGVVERYDRVRTQGRLQRVHQEDICQALSLPPTRKYWNEGGPGIRDIVDLLKTYSSKPQEDVTTFLDSVVYNWLIAGTDAHAKNYSLLIGGGGRVRLAPLYDVASILPYDDVNIDREKVSMKIGGEYRLRNLRPYHWRKLAADLRLDPDATIDRVTSFAGQLADQVSGVKHQMAAEGLDHPVIGNLAEALAERVEAVLEMFKYP